MKTEKIILEEAGSDIQNFKTFLCKLINDRINDYKIQFLGDWEGNNKLSPKIKDRQIEMLQIAKKQIIDFLEKSDSETSEVNFKLNLELVVNDKTLVKNRIKKLLFIK